MSNNKNVNSVFYAELYHPIQAGSIDGTDILPHDAAVYRALRCYNAGLYDPFGDPKIVGDPYCTLFVGRLNHFTTDETLRQAMSKYGKVKNLRLVRHIVTGASRGYAFVEFETEREMRRAYKDAHHTFIDDSEIIVDYNRQQLMPGWIPRRLGGGLGGKKESGQLRFGGRERPFRAPLRQIPFDDLKRLGIPFPSEGRYLSRFEIPSPPRRKKIDTDSESESHKRPEADRRSHRIDQSLSAEPSSSRQRSSETLKDFSDSHEKSSRHLHPQKRNLDYDLDKDSSQYKKELFEEHKSHRQSHRRKRRSSSYDYSSDGKGSSGDKKDHRSDKRHKSSRHASRHERRSTRHDYSSDDNDSAGRRRSRKHTYSRKDERWSPRRNSPSVE